MIKIASNKIRWAISTFFALLILFGTYSNVFSLAAFLGCCLMVVFFDKESILLQLFFVMPMANIFKLSPTSQSFFTILLLLYVVLHLVLPRKATLLVILFAIYVVVGELFAGQFLLFRTIKLLCSLLFLSSILNGKVDVRHREIFLSYIIGTIVASIFGTMDSGYFKIKAYTGVEEYRNPNAEEIIERFTGLYGDPNYYVVGVIIAICLVVILYHRKELKTLPAFILITPIIYFLIITYSKSAIIMLIVPLFCIMFSFYKKKNHLAMFALMFIAVIVILLATSGQIPALEIITERFLVSETTEGVDVNSLTTGRLNIWIRYIKYLIHNFSTAVLGSGIASEYVEGRAAHNTYIESIYHLGVVGSTLLVAILTVISKQSLKVRIKRNVMNYSIMICIVAMYFFLSELFYFDPPFHIFLAFMVLNLPCEKESLQIKKVI